MRYSCLKKFQKKNVKFGLYSSLKLAMWDNSDHFLTYTIGKSTSSAFIIYFKRLGFFPNKGRKWASNMVYMVTINIHVNGKYYWNKPQFDKKHMYTVNLKPCVGPWWLSHYQFLIGNPYKQYVYPGPVPPKIHTYNDQASPAEHPAWLGLEWLASMVKRVEPGISQWVQLQIQREPESPRHIEPEPDRCPSGLTISRISSGVR